MNADVDITEDLEALKAIAADTKRLRTEASQLRESLAVRAQRTSRRDKQGLPVRPTIDLVVVEDV